MATRSKQTGNHLAVAAPAAVDISVVLPFRDDEDIVGTACSKISQHLRDLGLSFELLAIEEDSGDNSHAVLGLLRRQIPELEVLYAPSRDRGFATGSHRARGRSVLLIDAASALKPLAAIDRAVRRVAVGEVDVVIARDRFAVCQRTRTISVLSALRGRKLSLLKRRLGADRIEEIGKRRRPWSISRGPSERSRPFGRLIAALTLPRS